MIPVDSLDDPRLASYRKLRDRTLRGERMFVAEGRLLVERLLASRFEVESLLTHNHDASAGASTSCRRASSVANTSA